MRLLLILCSAAFFLFGCKDNGTGSQLPNPLFAIDLQTNFDRDIVRVQLDDKVVFNDTATTNPVLGLARHLVPAAVRGTHSIKVAMANTTSEHQSEISITDTTIVAVLYNRQSQQFTIKVYNSIIPYD